MQIDRADRTESSPPPQFDSSDLGSPKKVWSLLCQKDDKYRRDPTIFQRQNKITPRMRSMLIDWLMDVCADKHLHRETFHLCMDYIDRYICLVDDEVLPQRLQLIGATALVIATKIEEIYPPKVAEIAEYTDGCCSEQDLRDLEEIMLQQLDWTCYPITAVHWLALYMQLMNTNDVLPARQVILTAGFCPSVKRPLADEPCSPNSTTTSAPSTFVHDGLPSLNVSIVSDMDNGCEELEEELNLTLNDSYEGDEEPPKMKFKVKKEEEEAENHKPSHLVTTPKKQSTIWKSNPRVFSFNTSYPRIQLSHVGTSPRVMLHTAVADISYVGHRDYSNGHIYPDQRCTVPKLMRGEFVRLATILDLVLMDAGCFRYSYRELATAVLLCSYEPEHLLCQITGLGPEKLRGVRDFVDPFVQLYDRLEPTGTVIPCIPHVQHDDRHNIQTYLSQCLAHLDTIDQMRKQLEQRRKALQQRVSSRLRKRKFGATVNAVGKSHEI